MSQAAEKPKRFRSLNMGKGGSGGEQYAAKQNPKSEARNSKQIGMAKSQNGLPETNL
jgi:hypothetical protein